jgi:hypothetical protein
MLRAAFREELCGGAMYDALLVGEHPAIPTRFQAHNCCDTNRGKESSK